MTPRTCFVCTAVALSVALAAITSAAAPPSLGLDTDEKDSIEAARLLARSRAAAIKTLEFNQAAKAEFKIDSKTPAYDLLPDAPQGKPTPVYLGDDLSRVPEVVFEAAPAKALKTPEWTKRTAHTLAKMAHLNTRKQDGFVKTLISERRDLVGLPFLMGDDCRSDGDRTALFREIATAVRSAGDSWEQIRGVFDKVEDRRGNLNRDHRELAVKAGIAAVTQITWPESIQARLGLVKHLAGVSRKEATHELARLAVFAPEKKVREAAIEALSVRRESDYTDVLLKGLRYPWPAVSQNTADAIVKLERKDLLAELVAVLDEPDPRLPRLERVDDRRVTVTPELVRINHHKSCMLCHAPADATKSGKDTFVAEVPLPSEELPSFQRGYNQRNSGLLVRLDMTYLRQDFSVMQKVKDADPWPEQQRFDFVVRKRLLSDDEAKDLRERLTKKEEGELSPYHRAAVRALRDLTGRDVEAKAAAWRKVLKISAK